MDWDQSPLPDEATPADYDWAIVHGLATATIQTTQILKEYYYYRHFADEPDQLATVDQALTDAIATLEALQTDLESLRQIIRTRRN